MDFGSCLQVGFFNVSHEEDCLQTDDDLSHDTNMKARGDKGRYSRLQVKICALLQHILEYL